MNGPKLLKQKEKKEKSHSIGWWQKKCDVILQKLGMELYPMCEVCGGRANCLHHFWPKSNSVRLRYDWDNLIPICNGCHMRHHQAGDPSIHGRIIEKRGMGWYRKVWKKRYNQDKDFKVNIQYYKGILEILQNKAERKEL